MKNFMGRDLITRRTLPFFFLIIFCSSAYADHFTIKNTELPHKILKAYLKDDGKFLWESDIQGKNEVVDGKKVVRIIEAGKGVWDNKEKRTWNSEVLYSYENDQIKPLWSKLIFYDTKGITIESLLVTYKPEDKKIYSVSSKNGNKEFEYKEGIIEKSSFGLCFANFDYKNIKELYVPMLTNEPAYYGMTFVNKGIENVEQDGKIYECYKVQMIPDLGMLGFVGALVPKTYFWYTVKAPHEFVRYEGLESGLGTPYVVMKGY